MRKINVLSRYFLPLLVFLFILLRLPSLFEPYWYGDEGIYLTIGQGLSRGLTLYRDIHDNKPPGLYYLAALGQTVFGFRLLLALCLIPTYYFFYRLARQFLTPRLSRLSLLLFLILTSIPLFEGNIANAEIFMLLPTIWGIYELYVHHRYLLSGLLLGLAFTIKIPVGVEFAFLFLWLLVTNLKKVKLHITHYLLLITGFVFPITLWGLYFALQGVFSEFLYSALLQNFGYISSWSTGTHSGSVTSGGLVTRGIFILFFWGIIYLFYHFRKIKLPTLFLLGWFAATVFGALLSARPYPHYLIQTLPPLCLLIMLMFNSTLLPKITIVLSLLSLVFFFFQYRFYIYPVLSYYLNFYFHSNSKSYFNPDISSIYNISSYLASHTSPSEKIFIWGDEPYIYALSHRLPVSRYTVAYHVVDFRQYNYVISQFHTTLPSYVVYYLQPTRPFPQLDQFLRTYYAPDQSIGRAIIFRRR